MVGDKVLIKPKNPQSQTNPDCICRLLFSRRRFRAAISSRSVPVSRFLPRVRNMKYGKRRKRVRCIIFLCRRMKAIWLYFLQNAAYEINFNEEKFLIVPHSAILMLVRDERFVRITPFCLAKYCAIQFFDVFLQPNQQRLTINSSDYNE